MEHVLKVESQIQDLRAEIRAIETKRNACVPVSRLPTELLCRVFLYVRDGLVGNTTRNQRRFSPAWIRPTSHVCHHWRDIALNYPPLWSRFDFDVDPPRWMGLQLQRSRQSLASVVFSGGRRCEELVLNILGQPQRLQTLELYPSSVEQVNKCIYLLCNVSAPHLRSLKLHMTKTPAQNPTHAPTLPSSLFSGGTPALRHLELSISLLPFSSCVYRGLTSLKLETVVFAPSVDPTEFFDMLYHSPDLKSLDIDFNFPATMNAFRYPLPVRLQKLEGLRLRAGVRQCATMLINVALPLSSTVDISIHTGSSPQPVKADMEAFAAALDIGWLSNPLEYLPSLDSHSTIGPDVRDKMYSIQFLKFWVSATNQLSGEFWFEEESFDARHKKDSQIPLRITSGGPDILKLPAIISSLDLELLDYVSVDHHLASHIWPALSKLSYLQSFCLKSTSAASFLEFVKTEVALHPPPVLINNGDAPDSDATSPPKTEQPAPNTDIYFPNLTTIMLYDIDCGYTSYRFPEQVENTPIKFDDFLNFLAHRSYMQLPIEQLNIRKCINFMENNMKEAEAYVDDVDWDFDEDEREDESESEEEQEEEEEDDYRYLHRRQGCKYCGRGWCDGTCDDAYSVLDGEFY